MKEEGTTFQELLDHVRKEMALSLLKDPKITLYDVSFLLGFSEQKLVQPRIPAMDRLIPEGIQERRSCGISADAIAGSMK